MLKDNEVIGAIVIYRQEVRPFADKQIEFIKLASQAVIADIFDPRCPTAGHSRRRKARKRSNCSIRRWRSIQYPPSPVACRLVLEGAVEISDTVEVVRLVTAAQTDEPRRGDVGILEIGVGDIRAQEIGAADSLPLRLAP